MHRYDLLEKLYGNVPWRKPARLVGESRPPRNERRKPNKK